MAVTPPSALKTGDPLTAIVPWTQKIVAYLRAITSRPSATVAVSITPNGTTFRVKPAAVPRSSGGSVAVPGNMAFLAEARTREENGADVVEVKMRGGTAQGLFGGVQIFNTTYWTPNARAPELFDDYDDNCDDVESADISDGELFWLEYDPEANAGEHWTIEHDTSLPQSAVAESDEESVHYFSFVTLFRVRLTESGKGVVQNHFGAVVVPTATNVVDVQAVESGNEDEGEGEGGGE